MKPDHRRHGSLAVALAIGLAVTLPACGNGGNTADKPHTGQTTALLIDHQSLPRHRHVDATDQLSRHYLALQAPGDRMLIALSPPEDNGQETAGDEAMARVRLAERPLASTRQLRRIRSLLEESADGRWQAPATALAPLIEQLNTKSSRRCLYLALDPRSATLPAELDTDAVPAPTRADGWQAFLLTPPTHDPERIQAWIRWLHHAGAERIQHLPLSSDLPRCPSL